jgi:hypothetical protein
MHGTEPHNKNKRFMTADHLNGCCSFFLSSGCKFQQRTDGRMVNGERSDRWRPHGRTMCMYTHTVPGVPDKICIGDTLRTGRSGAVTEPVQRWRWRWMKTNRIHLYANRTMVLAAATSINSPPCIPTRTRTRTHPVILRRIGSSGYIVFCVFVPDSTLPLWNIGRHPITMRSQSGSRAHTHRNRKVGPGRIQHPGDRDTRFVSFPTRCSRRCFLLIETNQKSYGLMDAESTPMRRILRSMDRNLCRS